MAPKEKAIQLITEFEVIELKEIGLIPKDTAKQYVLILVNEIIKEFTNKCCESANRRYWQEVKEEINKL